MDAAREGVSMKYRIEIDGKMHEVDIEEKGTSYVVVVDGISYEAHLEEMRKTPAGKIQAEQTAHELIVGTGLPVVPKSVSKGAPGSIVAPMPGTVLKVYTSEGENVKAGDVLMTLEAMKMENEISSPVEGVVKKVHVKAGQSVNTGDPLVVIS